MNRIPYPDKREMNKQIHLILDQSGMFEESGKDQIYTECVQVKRKPILRTTIIFPMAAAAIVLIVIAMTKKIPNQILSSTEPMTNKITDDTIRTVSKANVNQNITVEICTASTTLSSDNTAESAAKVEIIYNYPKVYYKGEEVAAITAYYQQKMEKIQETAEEKYNYIDITGRKKDSNAQAPVKILYNCSAVRGISTDENNLVTIYENYSENVRYNNEYMTVNEVYGSNFNAQDGHRISLEEIFSDTDSGLAEAQKYLKAKVKQENLSEELIEDGKWSWYLGADGLTLSVNDIEGEEKDYSGTVYRNYYSESFVVPYSSLKSLKSEYMSQ